MTYKLTLSTIFSAAVFSVATEAPAYDFNAYKPTLDSLYQAGESSIDSGYDLTFEKADGNADYDFVYQQLNSDNTVTPVYYKINYKYDGGTTNAVSLSRTTNYSAKDEIAGYFKDIESTYYGSPAALYNLSGANELKKVVGDFINNRIVISNSNNAFGGAVTNGATNSYTTGKIGSITGDFIGNSAITTATSKQAGGGAIMNIGTIREVSGIFINNFAKGYYGVGGAISNTNAIGDIHGTFIGNFAEGTITRGGAIYNSSGSYSDGTSVSGTPKIPEIRADFIGNYVTATDNAIGGAIYNIAGNNATVPDIYGNFIGNYAYGIQHARAGAIDASEGINTITGNFIGNYAESKESNSYAGAVFVGKDMRFVADGLNNYFSGNYVKDINGKIYNAIYINGTNNPKITFDITGSGNLYFNDSIMGGRPYDVDIIGYNTGKFFMNNYFMNAGNISVKDSMLIFNKAPYTDDDGCGSNCRGQIIAKMKNDQITPDEDAAPVTNLSLDNGQFYLYNKYIENVKLKNYSATGNSLLHIDVTRQNGEWTADKLTISEEIAGNTQVVVYDRTNEDNRGASVLFIEAPNDTDPEGQTPSVFRTYGSPYKWSIAYNYKGEASGSYWYLIGSDTPNDSGLVGFVPEPIEIGDPSSLPEGVTPEVTAYQGLHAAALEQTRSMTGNIRDKVAANKISVLKCAGVYDEAWNGEDLQSVWASPAYHTATIKSPVRTEADIWGLEAGFDIQTDIRNKLGIFGSYRKGNYDIDGSHSSLYSKIDSEIDIDSYIAGLYYRYDLRKAWLFATLYGGMQKADISTDDGVKGDSDAKQFGGSLEAGYLYDLNDTLKLEPGLGISYSRIEFDDIRDGYGKTASYDAVSLTEIEGGLKLEKYIPTEDGLAKVYIKPSIVLVETKGSNVTITGMRNVSSYDEGTLGRIEFGGRYGFSDALSVYGWANYSFGSDYNASSFGAGINYSW